MSVVGTIQGPVIVYEKTAFEVLMPAIHGLAAVLDDFTEYNPMRSSSPRFSIATNFNAVRLSLWITSFDI